MRILEEYAVFRLVMFFLCISFIAAKDSTKNFDPKKIPFCKMGHFHHNRKFTGQHVACDCSSDGTTVSIETDQEKFREEMLKLHNTWRNKMAMGQVDKFPSANNMEIMNYDYEMEYIVKCYAAQHDKNTGLLNKDERCDYTTEYTQVDINVCHSKKMKPAPTDFPVEDAVKILTNCYNDHMKAFLDFNKTEKDAVVSPLGRAYQPLLYKARAFVLATFWQNSRFGCHRAIKGKQRMLVCMYGGAQYLNLIAHPFGELYKPGPTCSWCRYNMGCRSKDYPALCVVNSSSGILTQLGDEEGGDGKNMTTTTTVTITGGGAAEERTTYWRVIVIFFMILYCSGLLPVH